MLSIFYQIGTKEVLHPYGWGHHPNFCLPVFIKAPLIDTFYNESPYVFEEKLNFNTKGTFFIKRNQEFFLKLLLKSRPKRK